MKRLTALLLALLALALPALAEPMALLDYTDDILEDGSPIYYFQELSLKLPADCRGRAACAFTRSPAMKNTLRRALTAAASCSCWAPA